MSDALKCKLYNFIFYSVIGALYAYALSVTVMTATILSFSTQSLLVMSILFTILLGIIGFNRYTLLGTACVALSAGTYVFFSLRAQEFEARWFLELREFITGYADFLRDSSLYQEEYGAVSAIGIAFLLSLMAALGIRLPFGFYVLSLAAVGVFGVPFYMGWNRSGHATMLMLFCFIALLSRKLCTGAFGENGTGVAAALCAIAMIPASLIVFGASWLLPKPDAQLSRVWFNTLAEAASRAVYGIPHERAITFTGDGQRLGGPVPPDDRVIMEVRADERLYLSCDIKDTYTGYSWYANEPESGGEPSRPEQLLPGDDGWIDVPDYSPRLTEIQRYYMWNYEWGEKEVAVFTNTIREKAVYSPPFRTSLRISGNVPLRLSGTGAVIPDKQLERNAYYRQKYFSFDYADEAFAAILRNTARWGQDAGLSPQELEPYLALPESLPERVYTLARSLTDDLYTDYDKLLALEEYLAAFPYTLTPEPVPYGEDFVDYFLFTGKEGYCVYYASALAVMARCVGIPTRFMEGYILPEEHSDGLYIVTGNQAHAWTEAWFAGFGWVRFEATSLYYEAPGGAGEEEPEPEAEQNEERETPPPISMLPPEELWQEYPSESGQYESGVLPGVPLAVAVPACVVALFFVAVAGLRVRYRARLEKLDVLPNREAAIAWFARILSLLNMYGYSISPTETAAAFADRLGGTVARMGGVMTTQLQHVRLEALAEIFARASYSAREITDRDILLMKACYPALIEKLKTTRSGRLRALRDHLRLLTL